MHELRTAALTSYDAEGSILVIMLGDDDSQVLVALDSCLLLVTFLLFMQERPFEARVLYM